MKLFIVLFICTAFIFSSSHFGAYAFEQSKKGNEKYITGTSMGPILIDGKTQMEASALLHEKIVNWKKDTKIFLQYGDQRISIDLNLFHFDQEKTINKIKNGQKTPIFVDIYPNRIAQQISLLFPQLSTKDFDMIKLTAKMIETASSLQTGNFTFNVFDDYLKPESNGIITNTTIKVKRNSQELQLFLISNSKIEIPAHSNFSLLDLLKKKNLGNLDPEILSVIATGIYNVILPTNFSINERDIGNSLPSYASLGYEAKIDPNQNLDLAFYNPNKGNYYIQLNMHKKNLIVSLIGNPFPYSYKVVTKDINYFVPKKIIQYSPVLSPGQTIVTTKGVAGQYVKVYKDEFIGNSKVKEELVAEDYYSPVASVEIHPLSLSNSDSNTITSSQQNQQETQSNSSKQSSPTSTTQVDANNDSRTIGK